jgi:hypothetical protein
MLDISASLDAIGSELKAIRHILSCLWHSKYFNDETDQVSPEFYADEYISTTECAKRLGVTEQTIRNWILNGKSKKKKRGVAWVQGIHYILIPTGTQKNLIRIGWNNLVAKFAKGEEAGLRSFDEGEKLYERKRPTLFNVPGVRQDNEE